MPASIQKILIPVDFSSNTQTAIRNSCLLTGGKAIIHLLYVQYYGYPLLSFDAARFIRPDEKKDHCEAKDKLEKYQLWLKDLYPELSVSFSIDTRHNVQDGIIAACADNEYDLIVIGKKSNHRWFPYLNIIRPEKISIKTGYPVLICKPGSMDHSPSRILVRVNLYLEECKLKMIEFFSQKKEVETYLLAFDGGVTEKTTHFETSSSYYYQHVRLHFRRQAHCQTEAGKYNSHVVLKLAKQVHADLLILKAGVETKFNWFGRQVYDVINPASAVQILIVN
jgi:nucleotide-binding universal stress UspA family protein